MCSIERIVWDYADLLIYDFVKRQIGDAKKFNREEL